MVVEDHPRYPEWRRAHDDFEDAQRRLDEAQRIRRPEGELLVARQARDQAQALFDLIANNMRDGDANRT
ncbi:hypothetical protein DFR50_14069 [Roseiarcus fermentans]|uniref:Uncharacterized protein n=1 Tax=Roseiarcus fermentans TaxID=1473586 RepID=A0A366EQG8_9HYPH|nr:hypothetical protein [Roseiarcus fermentans]RBP04196.1 hypothetical protein DFR50_14069 [Roseiarcus fermentans]